MLSYFYKESLFGVFNEITFKIKVNTYIPESWIDHILNRSVCSVENELEGCKIGGRASDRIVLESGWVMTVVAQRGDLPDTNSRHNTYQSPG